MTGFSKKIGRTLAAKLCVRNRKGQALAEATLVMPFLLVVLLGVIESGNGLSIKHKMITISREGANIASRGSSLQETLNTVMALGGEINLLETGGAVITRIIVDEGEPLVDGQVAFGSYSGSSRFGVVGDVATPLTDINTVEGQAFYVVEIFYEYEGLTPIGRLLPDGWVDQMYERAVF